MQGVQTSIVVVHDDLSFVFFCDLRRFILAVLLSNQLHKVLQLHVRIHLITFWSPHGRVLVQNLLDWFPSRLAFPERIVYITITPVHLFHSFALTIEPRIDLNLSLDLLAIPCHAFTAERPVIHVEFSHTLRIAQRL